MKPNCSNSYRNNNGGQLLLVGNKRWNKQASHSCLIALFFLCNAGKKAKRKKKEIFLVGKDAGIIKVLFAFFSCFLSYNAGENEKRKKNSFNRRKKVQEYSSRCPDLSPA
jgi:hypothetical protein